MLHPTRSSRARPTVACLASALMLAVMTPARAQDAGGAGARVDAFDRSEAVVAGQEAGGEAAADDLAQDLLEPLPPDQFVDVPPPPVLPQDEEEDALLEEVDPYAPLGFRLGSFLLFPEIEAGSEFTDNVFLTKEDPRADHAFFFAPGLTFRSTWSRHELSGLVNARRSYYDTFTSEDDRELTALLRGRLDLAERTNVVGELEHSREQEDRDDFGFPEGAIGRADVVTERAALEGSHTFNRLTVSLRGSVTQEQYGELELAGGTGTESGSDRNNTVHEVGGRATYELHPGMAAFIDWASNERRFRQDLNADGTRTGSAGYALQAGLAFALTDKVEGEISAGFAHQTPNEPSFDVIEGFILNADLAWRATALTTVRFRAESDIDVSAIDTEGAFSRLYEIGVEHALRRNIIIGAALGYRTETENDTGDETRDWRTAVSAEYLLNRWVGIKGEYVHTTSVGEEPDDGYTENAVTLAITLRH